MAPIQDITGDSALDPAHPTLSRRRSREVRHQRTGRPAAPDSASPADAPVARSAPPPPARACVNRATPSPAATPCSTLDRSLSSIHRWFHVPRVALRPPETVTVPHQTRAQGIDLRANPCDNKGASHDSTDCSNHRSVYRSKAMDHQTCTEYHAPTMEAPLSLRGYGQAERRATRFVFCARPPLCRSMPAYSRLPMPSRGKGPNGGPPLSDPSDRGPCWSSALDADEQGVLASRVAVGWASRNSLRPSPVP